MSEPFVLGGLEHGVEDVLVGECAVSPFLHFLQFGLSVVEGQTAEGGQEP
jgi:hypothetical protein